MCGIQILTWEKTGCENIMCYMENGGGFKKIQTVLSWNNRKLCYWFKKCIILYESTIMDLQSDIWALWLALIHVGALLFWALEFKLEVNFAYHERWSSKPKSQVSGTGSCMGPLERWSPGRHPGSPLANLQKAHNATFHECVRMNTLCLSRQSRIDI